ncbi:MAG: phosphotransferase [Paracoccaceae bacterium]
MYDHLRDRDLPPLAALGRADLSRITGHAGTRLLRLRYQPGARAILHVALGSKADAPEGSIWFFAGTKAEKLAQEHPDAQFDPVSGALFQAFPQDHRLPHLAQFVALAAEYAPRLIGGPARAAPDLMRYRPGLSATFRWTRDDGQVFYVKQTAEMRVSAQAQALANLADAARGRAISFTPVAGLVPDLGLIAYASAPGLPLEAQMTDAAVAQVLYALRSLWSLPVVPGRVLDRKALLDRAHRAQQLVAPFDPQAGQCAADLVARLESWTVPVRLRPIHADMKLEHVFLSGRQTTLIDIESLSLGDPDYDLAALDARVTMAQLTGNMTNPGAEAARQQIRKTAGPGYMWFLTCARLQCARFFAQRLDPATIPILRQVLADG